jgi:hypothetical protein
MGQKTHDYGDQPIQGDYREAMQTLARHLDGVFNGELKPGERKVGFVLLVFPFGEGEEGRCNYISNGASRKEIIQLFREQANRFAAEIQ